MADAKHPAFPGTGPIFQAVVQFRRSFPGQLTADALKKLGLASGNEGKLLGLFRFLNLIDKNGNGTPEAQRLFTLHGDEEFATAFEPIVQNAYADLFDLHGNAAWTLEQGKLISYFRQSDQTSALIGQRQAATFHALASLSGHASGTHSVEVNVGKARASKTAVKKTSNRESVKDPTAAKTRKTQSASANDRDVGLTVRIEVNLPAGGDQETYDRIFRSIREHLIDG